MKSAARAFSQHCILMSFLYYPLQFMALCGAVYHSESPVATAIKELLFDLDYLDILLTNLENTAILETTERVQILEIICSIMSHSYTLRIHKFLERFLPTIPVELLIEPITEGHSQITGYGFQPLEAFHNEKNKTTTSLNIQFKKHFRPLHLTYNIYHWHHNLIRSFLFERRKTFLTSMQEWTQNIQVEDGNIDEVRAYMYTQAKHLRMEFEIYHSTQKRKPKSFRFCQKTKFRGPKIRNPQHIDRLRQFLHAKDSHPALDLIPDHTPSKIVKLAALISRKFFGALYQGRGCSVCLKRYLVSKPCSREDISRAYFVDHFNRYLTKCYSDCEFDRAMTLVMQYYTQFYDEYAIKKGIQIIVVTYLRRDFDDYILNFSEFFKFVKSLIKGIVRSPLSVSLQRILQSQFEFVEDLTDKHDWPSANFCTDEMVEKLVRTIKMEYFIEFLELASCLDLDCICHGRILQKISLNPRLLNWMILSLPANDPRTLPIFNALGQLQCSEGERLIRSIRKIANAYLC